MSKENINNLLELIRDYPNLDGCELSGLTRYHSNPLLIKLQNEDKIHWTGRGWVITQKFDPFYFLEDNVKDGGSPTTPTETEK